MLEVRETSYIRATLGGVHQTHTPQQGTIKPHDNFRKKVPHNTKKPHRNHEKNHQKIRASLFTTVYFISVVFRDTLSNSIQ